MVPLIIMQIIFTSKISVQYAPDVIIYTSSDPVSELE